MARIKIARIKIARAATIVCLGLASCLPTPIDDVSLCGLTPPEEEIRRLSPFDMFLSPNPAAAGGEAILAIGAAEPDAVGGAGASWQCWNGSAWETTHQLIRGGAYDGAEAVALVVTEGATSTIPAIGLMVPNEFPIVIPEVAPGAYRIEDRVHTGQEELVGFVIVEVAAAP